MEHQTTETQIDPSTPRDVLATLTADHQVAVFADITCPFAHVGLRRFVQERDARGLDRPLGVLSWPLELINGGPQRGPDLAPKIAALRRSVAGDLFAGFDPDRFPSSSMTALALVAAAYRQDKAAGERLSMSVRTALFEEGADIADLSVLADLTDRCGLPGLVGDDDQVTADWHLGQSLDVVGSPHFMVAGGDFFCPALSISRDDHGMLDVSFDQDRFLAVLGLEATAS